MGRFRGRGCRLHHLRVGAFTKPVTRITGLLRSLGKLPDSAVQVLKAQYAGPGPATGFAVHPLLVPLINDLAGDDEE
ncbi:hypothetical protein [Streptomyces pharetrae]|uniref:hypothetical protein n=1 Tax=Streptomyces pharetrae TaxID=291370 RepID=UPI00369F3523